MASGVEAQPSARGSDITTQPSANRAKSRRPPTASTESRKPRSKATGGHSATATAAAAPKALRPSARRPPETVNETSTAISQARTADAWTPLATTYSPRLAETATATAHGRILARQASHVTMAATTTR